jgi:hypothetical protein
MKKFALILFLMALSFYATGQSTYDKRVGFNLVFGLHYPLMSQLNDELESLNFEPLKPAHGNAGFGVNINLQRHFFEFSYNFFGRLTTQYNEDDIGTRSDGFSGGMNYGWEFIIADYLTTIPFIGIGIDFLNVHIIDKNQTLTDFHTVLNTRNQTDLKFGAMGFNMGCQFIIPIDFENSFAGLKISYTIPFKSDWETDDVTLSAGPKINPGGFFIGLNYIFYL